MIGSKDPWKWIEPQSQMSPKTHVRVSLRRAVLFLALALGNTGISQGQQVEPGGTLAGFGIISEFIPPGTDNAIAVAVTDFSGVAALADGQMITFGFFFFPDVPGAAGDANGGGSVGADVVNVWASMPLSIGLQKDGDLMVLESSGVPPPTIVTPETAIDLVDADVSFDAILGLRSDGKVVGWGPINTNAASIDVPEGLGQVVDIACTQNIGLALKADGSLVQWGNTTDFSDPPQGLTDVMSIEINQVAALALRSDGSTVSWGRSGNEVDLGFQGPIVEIVSGSSDNNFGGVTRTAEPVAWPETFLIGLHLDVFGLALGPVSEESVFIQKPGMLPFANIMPQAAKKLEGTDVVLRAHAVGAHTFQWKRDGIDLPGETRPWLFIESLDASEVGDYTVLMTNMNGSFETDPTRVELDLIDQEILVEPFEPSLFGGSPFQIVASATSGLPIDMEVEYGPATIDRDLVRITGNGTVRIVISQPGNADYESAPPIVIEYNTGDQPGPLTVGEVDESEVHLRVPWFTTHRIGVEFSTDLTPGSWIELGNFSLEQGRGVFVDRDMVRLGHGKGYYRAFLRPPLR